MKNAKDTVEKSFKKECISGMRRKKQTNKLTNKQINKK